MVSHPLVEGLLGDDRVARVLSDAPQAYLTVLTSTGPHSTPQVFLAWAGRIWMMTGRKTVKAKVLRGRPEAAVLARSGDASVVVTGVACLLDPLRPHELLPCVRELMLSGPATAGYLARNPTDLRGFVRDALAGRLRLNLPPSPPVLVALRPRAVTLVRGHELVAAEGEWPGQREAPSWEEPMLGNELGAQPFREAPAPAARLLADERPCVVGWEGPTGPLGLPGTWHGDHQVASVAPDLFGLGSLPRHAPASVTVDAIDEHDPTSKLGVVVRGPATAHPTRRTIEVRVEPERVTWWQGTETETQVVA
ncbi:MAG: hypothetical protein M3179_12335 [Actinomycetota bacterium]|nr:hypothetical protein [Actinomycetota bacterium]